MENLEMLARVFFFQELTPDQLAKIAAIVQPETLRVGQKVFEAGSESDAFYLIKRGAVMVKKGTMVLATPQAGDCIGEISFIDRGKRSADSSRVQRGGNVVTGRAWNKYNCSPCQPHSMSCGQP